MQSKHSICYFPSFHGGCAVQQFNTAAVVSCMRGQEVYSPSAARTIRMICSVKKKYRVNTAPIHAFGPNLHVLVSLRCWRNMIQPFHWWTCPYNIQADTMSTPCQIKSIVVWCQQIFETPKFREAVRGSGDWSWGSEAFRLWIPFVPLQQPFGSRQILLASPRWVLQRQPLLLPLLSLLLNELPLPQHTLVPVQSRHQGVKSTVGLWRKIHKFLRLCNAARQGMTSAEEVQYSNQTPGLLSPFVKKHSCPPLGSHNQKHL